jgi:hypothetical protein
MLVTDHLPADIEALKALLLASERRVQERDGRLGALNAQFITRAAVTEHLKLQIAKLRRMKFGRKSEKLDHQIDRLELQWEDLQADDPEATREMPQADRAPRNKPARKPLPKHLPRDEHVHLPSAESCPTCGVGLRRLGEDVAEQLEYVAGQLRRDTPCVPQAWVCLLRYDRADAGTSPVLSSRIPSSAIHCLAPYSASSIGPIVSRSPWLRMHWDTSFQLYLRTFDTAPNVNTIHSLGFTETPRLL